MVHAKDPPSYYLAKLRTYLDPKASRSHRVSTNQTHNSFSNSTDALNIHNVTNESRMHVCNTIHQVITPKWDDNVNYVHYLERPTLSSRLFTNMV